MSDECKHSAVNSRPEYAPEDTEQLNLLGSTQTCLGCGAEQTYDGNHEVVKEWTVPNGGS